MIGSMISRDLGLPKDALTRTPVTSSSRSLAGLPRKIGRELKVHGQSAHAGRTGRRLASQSRPLLLGPWTSEVGFELLYWIPMLRRLLAGQRRDRRVVVVSRGGVGAWYADVADEYHDLLDIFAPDDLREDHERRVARKLGQKQARISPFDLSAIARVAAQLDLDAGRIGVLHPWVMYRRFRAVWMRRRPPKVALAELSFAPLASPRPPADPPYIAVKAYHSEVFPETAANVERLRTVVARLASNVPVRVIRSGVTIDDHRDVDLDGIAGVDSVVPADPRDNLASQAAVVAGAQALITTYGGFGYMGPMLSVPTVTFYARDAFNSVHLDVLRGAVQTLRAEASDPARVAFMSVDVHHSALDPLIGWLSTYSGGRDA